MNKTTRLRLYYLEHFKIRLAIDAELTNLFTTLVNTFDKELAKEWQEDRYELIYKGIPVKLDREAGKVTVSEYTYAYDFSHINSLSLTLLQDEYEV